MPQGGAAGGRNGLSTLPHPSRPEDPALRTFRQAQVNRAKRKAARWARRVEVAAFAVFTALVVGSAVASLAGSIQLPFIAVPPGLRWPARILFLALLVVGPSCRS
jgi:hypothetical protein